MKTTPRCVGCLGTLQCWICTGDGCRRCESSGICHVCRGERLLQLLPRQAAPVEDPLARRR